MSAFLLMRIIVRSRGVGSFDLRFKVVSKAPWCHAKRVMALPWQAAQAWNRQCAHHRNDDKRVDENGLMTAGRWHQHIHESGLMKSDEFNVSLLKWPNPNLMPLTLLPYIRCCTISYIYLPFIFCCTISYTLYLYTLYPYALYTYAVHIILTLTLCFRSAFGSAQHLLPLSRKAWSETIDVKSPINAILYPLNGHVHEKSFTRPWKWIFFHRLVKSGWWKRLWWKRADEISVYLFSGFIY